MTSNAGQATLPAPFSSLRAPPCGAAPGSVNLWFDGSCEPVNPGGTATAGWYVTDGHDAMLTAGYGVVATGYSATSCFAEWRALELALEWLRSQAIYAGSTLTILGDSQLVINQLTGRWACRAPNLQPLLRSCLTILVSLGLEQWDAVWISRDENYVADMLARAAYQNATGQVFPERNR